MHYLRDPVICLYSIIYMTTLQGKDSIIPIWHTEAGLREVKSFSPALDRRVRQGVEGAGETPSIVLSDSYKVLRLFQSSPTPSWSSGARVL